MLHSELTSTAQTAYAQLLDSALAESTHRSVRDLGGSFSAKKIKGRAYWYYSFREGSKVRQIYVGPDNVRTQALVAEKQASEVDADAVERMALAYVAHGATTLLPKHLRLIARMEEFGFFRVGGVLVGTHAFASYANMLGVKWGSSDQTMDVDLAMPGQSISIAVPEAPTVDLHDALSSFEAGFVPTRAFDGKAGTTYSLKHDSGFQIDFLTTIDKRGDDPRIIEALAVTAKPLKFLEYAVEAPTQAVALDRNGRHVVINLPSPERYAVHKLIVQGERDARYKVKAVKDVHQAAALIEHFVANNPRALKEAWGDAYERGPGWRKRLDEGLEALSRSWPAQHHEMKSQIAAPTAGKRAIPKKRDPALRGPSEGDDFSM